MSVVLVGAGLPQTSWSGVSMGGDGRMAEDDSEGKGQGIKEETAT